MWKAGIALLLMAGLAIVGCEQEAKAPSPGKKAKAPSPGKKGEAGQPAATSASAGDPSSVAFAVAWCQDDDPEAAAATAAEQAIRNLGCPPKGAIFYEYYGKTVKGDDGEDKEVPDPEKDKLVLPGIRSMTKDIPLIGCRARSLVNGGTMLDRTVACLVIGGAKVSCKAMKAELADDRKAVGTAIGTALKDVADLKIVFALSEMRLSFETKENVSVEDLIRGVLETSGKDVVLLGGNCMPNDYPADKGGVQFMGDEVLEGHVVAMGIGGPIAVHANHTNEFDASAETIKVTKAEDKWVYELDGKPATEVYRQIRGMKDDEEFSSDSEHPIGVVVTPEKVYLRMVLAEDKERKGLKFVAAVPVGTEVKVLKGGRDAARVLASAKEGIVESVRKAGDAKPLVALISDCCARGARLRKFRQASECEVKQAILPALGDKAGFPIFGFYAWGELGPIAGPFHGLPCMYQQHTFVSAVLTEAK